MFSGSILKSLFIVCFVFAASASFAQVTIISCPTNESLIINGNKECKTPCSVDLSTDDKFITVEYDGRATTFTLGTSLAGNGTNGTLFLLNLDNIGGAADRPDVGYYMADSNLGIMHLCSPRGMLDKSSKQPTVESNEIDISGAVIDNHPAAPMMKSSSDNATK